MRIISVGLIVLLTGVYAVMHLLNKAGPNVGPAVTETHHRSHPETETERFDMDPGPEFNMKALEQDVFVHVNAERRKHGLGDLVWREDLADVARRHSCNMGSRRFFSHEDPVEGDLKRRMDKARLLDWRSCGENILMESFRPAAGRSAVEGWMKSPGHRKNILNPGFSHTGIGVAVGQDNLLYFTQNFLLPRN